MKKSLHILSNILLYGIPVFAMVTIFYLDIISGLKFTFGSVYTIVLLYSWILNQKHITISIAILSTGLMFSKLVILGGETLTGISVIVSLIPIWVTTILVLIAKNSSSLIENNNKKLLELVDEQYNKILEIDFQNQLILKDIPTVSLITLDLNGKITSVNQGALRLFNIEENNLHQKHINDLIVNLKFHADTINSSSEVYLEQDLFYNEIPIKVVLKSFINSHKELIGYSLVINDKTSELKLITLEKRNAVLFEKRKEFDELINVTSHYLQEPLSKIKNVDSILKSKYLDETNSKTKDFLNIIKNSIDEIENFVQGLNEYSQTGRNFKIETVDGDNILKQLVKKYDSTKIQNTGKCPKLLTSKIEFKYIFEHLIQNSIYFNKGDNNLLIRIEYINTNEAHQFIFNDNGIGINADFNDRVFNIFKTIGDNKSADKKIGLGLATIKKIIELLGGSIIIDPQYKEGLQYKIELPKVN